MPPSAARKPPRNAFTGRPLPLQGEQHHEAAYAENDVHDYPEHDYEADAYGGARLVGSVEAVAVVRHAVGVGLEQPLPAVAGAVLQRLLVGRRPGAVAAGYAGNDPDQEDGLDDEEGPHEDALLLRLRCDDGNSCVVRGYLPLRGAGGGPGDPS